MDDHEVKFIDVPKAVVHAPVRKKGIPKNLRRQSIHLGWDDDDVAMPNDVGARRDSTTKESVVLEFYNPQLQAPHGRRPSTTHAMTRANYALDRVAVIQRSRSVVTFVDPLENATRRDLKRSNLLHPVAVPLVMSEAATPLHVGASPPKHRQPQRCPQCHSNHVILVPVCKYCKKMAVLCQDYTALKRHAYAIVEKDPSIAPIRLIDEVVGFLHEYHQQEVAQPPNEQTAPGGGRSPDPAPIDDSNKPVLIPTDEVNQFVVARRHNQPALSALSTRDALLELKHARSKAATDVKPPQLSHTTKSTIVHYILDSLSQPHGEPPHWTKEQRWDHQDLCLEMLKTLSINDVNDIVRAYNAWKHVDNIALRHGDEAKPKQPVGIAPTDRRASMQGMKDAEDDEADQVVPDVRTFQLQRRKAIRPAVSPEKARQLIARRASIHEKDSALSPAASSPARRHGAEAVASTDEGEGPVVSLLAEHRHEVEAERAKQILLNAERHQTFTSDGMFYVDNTVFFTASLDERDLVVVLQFERQAQEMFLLGDEGEREALLHLSPVGRVDVVGEWIAKNVDDRNLLIAATRAKGQLLSSDERRLVLAMDDDDCRYHLHLWKHWQQQQDHHQPTPNMAFLQLHVSGRRRQREEFFRVPRFWTKCIHDRDMTVRPMPLSVVRPFLLGIYHAAAKQRIEGYDLVEFVVQYMTLEFGAQTKLRLQALITALEQYCVKDAWVFAFCRFCGIAEPLSSDCFTFYVSALECLQFAVPNRSQQADYCIPTHVFYPLFVKKALMALRAIANDANIDEAKWHAALRERRVLCPRKSVQGSPIHVVGVGAFMDLVVDIWLSNRRTMEVEMRRMFVQFDTDENKSLSYDEFKAFVQHCHRTLQNTVPIHRQATFCRRAVDEKNIVKLYGKCLMQSDQSEVNIDAFVLGGMENPLTLAMFGFAVPPTETTAGRNLAMQLIMRCMRTYVKRARAAKARAHEHT